MNEKDKLLKRIQAEDFAVYEVALYLDVHPTNKRALAYYQKHRDIVMRLKQEYQEKYGMLTLYENTDPNDWHWIDKPWPWEKEAN